MTSLLEGARKLVTRGSDIGGRVKGLDDAVQAARGRLDDALLDRAAEVVTRSAEPAGARAAFDSTTACALLGGIFEKALLAPLTGSTEAADALRQRAGQLLPVMITR